MVNEVPKSLHQIRVVSRFTPVSNTMFPGSPKVCTPSTTTIHSATYVQWSHMIERLTDTWDHWSHILHLMRSVRPCIAHTMQQHVILITIPSEGCGRKPLPTLSVHTYHQWCFPGTRGTVLWQNVVQDWIYQRPIPQAAPAWTGRCGSVCLWCRLHAAAD